MEVQKKRTMYEIYGESGNTILKSYESTEKANPSLLYS